MTAYRESREAGDRRKGDRPDLGLTEAQQTELQALRSERKEAGQAAREQFREAFAALLTSEQLVILEEIKASRPHCSKGKDGTSDDGGSAGDSSSNAATSLQIELANDGAPTSVDETSWERIKEQRTR